LENAALIGFEAIAASQQRRMLCPMRSGVLGAPCDGVAGTVLLDSWEDKSYFAS